LSCTNVISSNHGIRLNNQTTGSKQEAASRAQRRKG
jgi:hypothetical protein